MRAKELVPTIIGSKGFVLEDITVDTERSEMKLSVRPTKREQCRCGICHRKAPLYDKGRGKRRWRCLDVGRTESVCGGGIASRMLPETWRSDRRGALGAAWQPVYQKL